MKLISIIAIFVCLGAGVSSARYSWRDRIPNRVVIPGNQIKTNMLPCKNDEWRCMRSPNQKCIKKTQLCNGVVDCQRKEDESAAVCNDGGKDICIGDLEWQSCPNRWARAPCPKRCGITNFRQACRCVTGCGCPASSPFRKDTECFESEDKCPVPPTIPPGVDVPTPFTWSFSTRFTFTLPTKPTPPQTIDPLGPLNNQRPPAPAGN